ncbi:glycosyltransferase family 4 protein [Microbacterium testaceum]|uniref:glycosyltransferase family 4 protein n=1 Tax=Microbacterium testaceum TaxID=2033 RepID=UPI000AA05965
MRVLQVLLSPRIGGAESAAASLAEVWEGRGLACHMTYLDRDRPGGALARAFGLREAIREVQPDVIVSHSALPNVYSRLVAGAIPVICVLHSAARDFDDPKLKFAERLLQHQTRSVVAVSSAQREEYVALFPKQRVVLIPNGVASRFAPAAQFDLRGPVVTIGRVVAQKDPALWSAVTRAICVEHGSARFEWFGPFSPGVLSTDDERWHHRSDSPAVFRGPTKNVDEVLRGAAVLFHPARREAHSVALLEAAATGLPIVCSSDVAATMPQWLPMSVFSTGDARDATRAVRAVLTDLESWRERAIGAVPQVVDNFGIERTARTYESEMVRARQAGVS